MKTKKSLLTFVIGSIRNSSRTQILLLAIFGLCGFAFYSVRSINVLHERIEDYPDGFTISVVIMLALLIIGIALTIWRIYKDGPRVYSSIKNRYYSYLYIWYSEELLRFLSIQNDIRRKILDLLEAKAKKTEIAYYICMSDSWRKQDSHIQYLFQEEKYEELAMLKNADERRIEFEKTNDDSILKSSVAEDIYEAIHESLRLQDSLEAIDNIISNLKKKEEAIYRKLRMKK